jgi:hypothetical protein
MKEESEAKKEFSSLVKRLTNLWYNHEAPSKITLCYAEPINFDHANPDFKNLEKLQNQLRPLLMKFL